MAVKLADAFVQITARSEGLQKDVAKQLAGLGKVGEQVGKDAGDKFAKEFDAETKDIDGTVKKSLGGLDKFAASTGQSMGNKISSGINKTLKAGVIGVGVAAGGVLAASLTKGLGRLQGIDNAQAKLAGLGHEAKAVEGIMDDALAAVKGTAFGLEDAATIAASSVAAGVKPGEDLQRTLKLTGDAATIAGTDLSTMGSIINKVATSDMMQMDVANQMMDAGIPILQMVGEELGVTAEEARKMASDGEVSFETFQSALENGLGGAALKSGDTVQGAFANMQAAAGRFGAKLAEPIFKAAPAVFGSLGGAFDTLGEKLEPLIEDFAEWLAPRMEAFATETIPKLVDGVMGAVDSFIEFGGWVKDNAEWIKPLAAGIGGAVAAIYAWNTATNIAKGIQLAFNAVMAVNPIMLIVVALAAVTAGLVYFFTQTETGREVWSKFTTALGAGWDWVTEKLSAGWAWIQENVFNAFGRKMDELSIWWQNTTGQLAAAWQDVQMVFSAVWEAIKTAVFDAWNWYVNQVKANWDTVTNALNTAWTWVKDTFTNTWNAIKAGVFDAWNTAVNFLRDTFNTITTTISDKWTWLKDQLHTVWRWVDDNVFEKMKSALTVVKDSFGTAADGIKVLWDRVRAAAAAPIRFVVDTVVNKGLIGAWNKVTGWVGLDPVDTIPLGELGSYATGTSRVPGPRSVGRDNMRFISEDGRHAINLAGQEGIAHQHVVDAIGSHNWDRLNAAAVTGGPNAVMRELGSFAGGGVVGSITGLVNKHFPMMRITSTYRNTNDHHGAGRAVDFSNGTDTTPQMQAAAAWFAQNYGPGLLELIHSPSPYNIKNGRSVGDGFGFYGAGTMAGHRNHVHVAAAAPLGAPGTPPPDLGDLPAGGFFDLGGMVKGLWDKAIGSIGKWDGGGLIGELPAAFAKSAASKLWDHISDKISIFDTGGVLEHGGVAKNMSGKPEAILTNAQWGKFNKMVGNMPALTESLEVVAEEIGAAFNGGDWGMGELASYIGIGPAESIINGAAALGEISRTIGEQAQKSGTDYATTQATGALDVMGLGGLVPLGQKLGAKAWDLYQASPYEVGFNGQSVTVEIEAESDADLIRVAEFKRLADQVHGLDVKVNQRPSAASITRGGVM